MACLYAAKQPRSLTAARLGVGACLWHGAFVLSYYISSQPADSLAGSVIQPSLHCIEAWRMIQVCTRPQTINTLNLPAMFCSIGDMICIMHALPVSHLCFYTKAHRMHLRLSLTLGVVCRQGSFLGVTCLAVMACAKNVIVTAFQVRGALSWEQVLGLWV